MTTLTDKELDELLALLDRLGKTHFSYKEADNAFDDAAAAIRQLRGSGEPVAWMWEHVLKCNGCVNNKGLSFDKVEPTDDAMLDGGSIFTRVTPLVAPQSAQGVVVPEECPRCKGSGRIMVTSFVDSSKEIENTCSICKGKGVLASCPAQGAQNAAGQDNEQPKLNINEVHAYAKQMGLPTEFAVPAAPQSRDAAAQEND